MSTAYNNVWPPLPQPEYGAGTNFIFIPMNGANSNYPVQGGYIYPPYGPYAFLRGNTTNQT